MKLSFVAERDLYNGGFTLCSVSQRFNSILRGDCKQRGLHVVFDLADVQLETLDEKVCIVCVCGCIELTRGRRQVVMQNP
jgi:hypothetical protein